MRRKVEKRFILLERSKGWCLNEISSEGEIREYWKRLWKSFWTKVYSNILYCRKHEDHAKCNKGIIKQILSISNSSNYWFHNIIEAVNINEVEIGLKWKF